MRLVGKASVPAGGPFIFSSLVHKISVTAGGLFISIQRHTASQLTFGCWFCHTCPAVQQLAGVFRWARCIFNFFFSSMRHRSHNYQPPPFVCHVIPRNPGSNLCGGLQREQSAACRKKHHDSTSAPPCGTT